MSLASAIAELPVASTAVTILVWHLWCGGEIRVMIRGRKRR
jgi:hypothetical protein